MLFEILVTAIVAPLLVAAILAAAQMARKMDRHMTSQDFKWQKNEDDHERAFAEIDRINKDLSTLKSGQIRIEKKIDKIAEHTNGR